MQDRPPDRWHLLLAALVLTGLVGGVYRPMLSFEFIDYDVRGQLLANPIVQDGLSLENVKRIFTSRAIFSYYPVRALTLAADHQIWGLDPAGFKLTNGLIHLANVLLVFWFALRLFYHPASGRGPRGVAAVGWAAFAAALFAIHPVVIEPVVWVAGREELLMVLGSLGCFHFHLTARERSRAGGRRAFAAHAAATLCCLAACLSNALGAVIPLLIMSWDLLTPGAPRWRSILASWAPLWVIAVATIYVKAIGPDRAQAGDLPGVFTIERILLVLNVYWLNLKTLVWPTELSLIYSNPAPQSFLNPDVIRGGVGLCVTGLVLWLLRRQTLMLFGLLWFGLALGPAAQIMPHYVVRSDRFLYQPLVGLSLTVAMGLWLITDRLRGARGLATALVPGVIILLVLQTLNAAQLQTWRDTVSMWVNCVRVNPRNGLVYASLANSLADREQYEDAKAYYNAAVSIDPNQVETLKYFSLFLSACPDERWRDHELAIRLASRACQLAEDPSSVMILAEVYGLSGQRQMAIQIIRNAMDAARAAGNDELAGKFESRLRFYRE